VELESIHQGGAAAIAEIQTPYVLMEVFS